MEESNFFKSKISPEKEDFITLTGEEIITRIKNQDNLNNTLALYLINNNKECILVDNLEKFEGLSHQEIAFKIIEAGKAYLVAYNIEKFEGLSHQKIAFKIIEADEANLVANNLEKFEGLNHQEIAFKIIEAGEAYSVAYNIEKFEGLSHQEIALKIIEAGEANLVANNLEKFEGLSRNTGNELIKGLSDFYLIIKVNEYFKPPLDKMITKTPEILGSFVNCENYNIIKKIEAGDVEIIENLKLKKGGNDGLRELQERLNSFKKEIIQEDFNPDILSSKDNESLYLLYFQAYIRYQEAEWGGNDYDGFMDIIGSFAKYKNKEKIKELNPNFEPSPELLIARSDSKAQEEHRFNEHFLNRFSVLINSIKKSKDLYQEKFPLSKLVEQIEERRTILIKELKEKVDKMPNPQAKEGINRKIDQLESINIRSIKDFQNNFSVLASNNDFNELLRQAVFLFSFSKNRASLNFNLNNINLDKPKIDDISWSLNFIDHIANQETMSKYFTDKKSLKMFKEIVSTQAINDEMSLLQGKGEDFKNKIKIQLIPTRGILTEFSGHIADACWASKYSSILKEFPNFTSVIIRQNPETKHERLAGAFMLIETESKEGEPLLVIRGLNPIENLINSLSVKDFYENIKEYLKILAEKDNRKLAIVIDNQAGGSGTNRPVLFSYLNKLSKSLKAIDLKSEEDTSFNEYNIVRQTYLVA